LKPGTARGLQEPQENDMHILNIGSVNIDHVYMVDHFVRPGETLSSAHYDIFAGGKGFNQSIALARAGAPTRHAGRVGQDAAWLLDRLNIGGLALARRTLFRTRHAG
jgi:ribokinase